MHPVLYQIDSSRIDPDLFLNKAGECSPNLKIEREQRSDVSDQIP